MEIIETGIKDLLLLKPKVFKDERGYFYESYNTALFKTIGIDSNFIQDNQSLSNKNILRGLHFQAPPFAQGKLVRVIKGAVLDVALDIRKNSTTYGQHFSVELTEENFLMLWIPQGFAHGFATLQDQTIFSYKCTEMYHPETEGGLLWNDREIGINWNIDNPILSEKDKKFEPFSLFVSPF
ncbi:MAG: dTDP-4-dehydrorhamnose 3,5-epimerase [Bacteroidetes bacterium]|nr:dTDP-4-dehydrorhamnose 3,5-epimerase [Bacteroidota bacterium]